MTSAIMNVQAAIPVTPPNSRALAAIVSGAVWYPLHVGTGTTVADKLGNGPTLTLSAAAGTIWSANWGVATPDGATQRFDSPANDAYLKALCRLDNLTGQELLVGFELQTDGGMTANEQVGGWGNQNNGAGVTGGWSVGLASNTQMNLATHAGNGASGAIFSTFPNSSHTGISAKILSLISIRGISAGVVDLTRHSWIVGTGLQNTGTVSAVNLLASGGAVPAGDAGSKLTLMARQIGVSSYDRYLGATAGSNGQLNNFWVARLASAQPGVAEQCLLDMVAALREFPISLKA